MNFYFKSGIYVVFLTFILSCKKTALDKVPINNLYPAIKIGQIKEYKVQEIIRILNKETQEEYFLREEVIDTLRFNQELYYSKVLYKSKTKNGAWVYFNTFFEYQNEKGVFEENEKMHIQKVGFPVSFSTVWKINQKIKSSENNTAKYLDFKSRYIFENKLWEDGYVIQVQNDSTGIHNFQEKEIYSPKFGLVLSTKKTIFYCQNNADCLGKNVEESKKIITKNLEKVIF